MKTKSSSQKAHIPKSAHKTTLNESSKIKVYKSTKKNANKPQTDALLCLKSSIADAGEVRVDGAKEGVAGYNRTHVEYSPPKKAHCQYHQARRLWIY